MRLTSPHSHSLPTRRETILFACFLVLITTTAAIILHNQDHHIFLYHGDAASHLVQTRAIIDSQRPGIHNIGTVWLPLPHLLLLPFTTIDSLFYSGIAAQIVGIPLLVGTGVLLFGIIRMLTGSFSLSFFCAGLFALNPNVVYIALTPMNEPSLLFFITLGGYSLLRWRQTDKSGWFVVCSVSVMLATLCRYEAWLLAPFISLVAILHWIQMSKKTETRHSIGIFFMSLIGWAGIALWLVWNYDVYGDPFAFANKTFTAGSTVARGFLHTHPQNIFLILAEAIVVIFGPALLFVCGVAFIRTRRWFAQPGTLLLVVYFALPVLFVLVSVLAGFVQVDQWRWNWRYVLTLGLLLSVVGAIGVYEFFAIVQTRFVRGIVVVSVAAMPFVQLIVTAVGVATFQDAVSGFFGKHRDAISIGEAIHYTYKEGFITMLTGDGQGHHIMITSRLPLKTFRLIHKPDEARFMNLDMIDQYLVIGKVRLPESQKLVDYWLARKHQLLRDYVIRHENNGYILLERKINVYNLLSLNYLYSTP